jgi:ribosomal 50S subunit-recycling heat shock protein
MGTENIESFSLRLDLFLKASRLVLRRSVAQQLCDAGVVYINGSAAKPSHGVKIGDHISLRRRNTILTVRVTTIPISKQPSRQDASSLYEVLKEEPLPDESGDVKP